MLEPGRSYTIGSSYRYRFNGKEQDPEVKGTGNQYDYGMRIYDSRASRFLSVDPLYQKYPELSPYQYASNRPIDGIDRDGLEYIKAIPKFQYESNGFDISKAIDNGVINVGNLLVNTWNSGVSTVQSLNKGTYGKDLGNDIKQTGSNIKNIIVGAYNYHTTTPASQQLKDFGNYVGSPNALEDVTTFTVSSYFGSGLNFKKGNLLTAETSDLTAAKTATTAETSGVPSFTNAKWSQPIHSNMFSKVGQEALGVKTIDEAVARLKSGAMKANDLPIDYIVRNNEVYILNTRSSVSLTKAGIERNDWNWVNRTGQANFEKRLSNQLEGSKGYNQVTNRVTGEVTKP